NGNVSIDNTGAGVTLNPTSFNNFVPAAGNEFIIIKNNGTQAINGTFAGLPEGTPFSNFLGSGLTARLTYKGGDGNDVAVVVDGPETFTSTGGALRLILNGPNLELRDGSNNGLEARPFAGVTSLLINGSATVADTLTVDYSGGNPLKPGNFLTFNGGPDATNDTLKLVGGSVTTIVYGFVNLHDGSVTLDGAKITYTG